MMVYGTGPHADDVLIAGTFVDPDEPTNTQAQEPGPGQRRYRRRIRWYNSPR